jgi:hypothetical protein
MRIFVRFPGAFFGGMVYMTAGFNTAWFFVLITGIWIPWIFWATTRYLEEESIFWGLAITISSLFLIHSNFYAVAGWAFYALSIYIIFWNLFFFKSWVVFIKNNIYPICFIALAFLIAFSSFVPVFDQLSRTDLSSRFSTGPLNPRYINLLLDPFYLRLLKAEYTVYTGIISLWIAGMGMIVFLFKNKRKQHFIFGYSLILLILTLSILFGVFKTEWIKLIPLFSFNPWNRLFSIIGFLIALLAALGFDQVYQLLKDKLKLNSVLLVLLILLVFRAQLLDQKQLFKSFNATVKSSWFYPETETLKHVKNSIQPLQTVIAGGAYFTGGTLGVYDIPEWFAHSTFTNAEIKLINQLLNGGWASTYLPNVVGSKINYSSPLMNAFGVKYILLHIPPPESVLNDIAFKKQYSVKKLEEKITLIENREVPSGAYFIEDLNLPPSHIISSNVLATAESDTRLHVESTLNRSGWLVIPFKSFPGWYAVSGSKRLPLKKYLGVFPAVKVSNQTEEVDFIYSPKTHMWGTVISYLGLTVFFLIAFIGVRKRKRQNTLL